MTRAEFSRRTKLKAWERAGGACETCGRKLYPGDRIEYDHRVTCEQGGDSSLENCALLCGPCHSEKTKQDAKVSAKSRSVRARHVGAAAPKAVVPGSRKSKWKRKANGRTVLRAEDGKARL